MNFISSILVKVLTSILTLGLERVLSYIQKKHARDKSNKKTTEAAKKFKDASSKLAEKIEKAEDITDEDIQEQRRAAHDLIDRFGNIK